MINPYKFGHNTTEADSVWDLVGLVYNGKGSYDIANDIPPLTKKKSFYAYKTLASKVQGKTDAEEIYKDVYRFSNGDDIVYVAWSNTTGNLPAAISGSVKITDYMGNEETKDASMVVLTDSPVFIETL